MSRFFIVAALLLFAPFIASVEAAAGELKGIRTADKPTGFRLVVDLTEPLIGRRAFLLANPKRAVIDLVGISQRVEATNAASKYITSLRQGAFAEDIFRLVIDLKEPLRIKSIFTLPPKGSYTHRLVVDFAKATNAEFQRAVKAAPLSSNFNPRSTKPASQNAKPSAKPPNAKPPSKPPNTKPMVVIDAGHGGIDPGALGKRLKTKEKQVTLKAAKILQKLLNESGKYRTTLTRHKDVYVPLRERINIARNVGGDLFISLHADSIPGSKSARGLSVYTLSERASDKEAAALARRENKADIIAGVDFSTQSKEITDILIDLTQRETMNYSAQFARNLLDNMRGNVKLLKRTHRFAGFAVLKAPDVPSVLIELGYLSHPTEEKNLRNTAYLTKMMRLIKKGIDTYFADITPTT